MTHRRIRVPAALYSAHPMVPDSSRPERRARQQRRRRHWWALWYGSFYPRRRAPARRRGERHFHAVDWYSARLLAVAVGIAVLSVTDAFLTLQLLEAGADEINPVMAAMLYRGVQAFIISKIGLTCVSTIALVWCSSHRFMRLVRVEVVMHLVLAAYVALIGYEVWLLRGTLNVFNL
jgi:hypothetical protein